MNAMNKHQPEISVVILCYRAGGFAAVFAEQMKKTLEEAHLDYELVLVGNYHAQMKEIDSTPRVVSELAAHDSRIVAVVKEKKGMMGWDMRSGLDAARGKCIAVIDGDGQMPPADVVKVYRALRSGSYDIAKTYRDTRFDGWFRVLISKVYNLLSKILFPKVRVRDMNSKPKIFTAEALRKLRLSSDDWFIDAEMIIKGSYLGMKIAETPTIFHPNANRPSFVKPRAILEFVRHLIGYRIRLSRGTLL